MRRSLRAAPWLRKLPLAGWILFSVARAAECPLPPESMEEASPGLARLPDRELFSDIPEYAVSLRWENDVLAGRDRDYSNGMSIAFATRGEAMLGRFWRLFGEDSGRCVCGCEVAQMIMTPANIKLAIPDPEDRPYSGVLYGAFTTQYIRDGSFHGLKLIVGVVGPSALAKETQRLVHELTRSDEPRGWDHQLKDEPIVNVVYEHRRRFTLLPPRDKFSVELIPTAGVMFGNLFVQAHAGAQLRAGFSLPDDFGTTLLRGLGNLPFPHASRKEDDRGENGVYVFAGGGGNIVGRNLTLDGNTFRDSPRVEKELFFPAAEFGVSFWSKHFQATFSYVLWGEEYKRQRGYSQFAAMTATLYF